MSNRRIMFVCRSLSGEALRSARAIEQLDDVTLSTQCFDDGDDVEKLIGAVLTLESMTYQSASFAPSRGLSIPRVFHGSLPIAGRDAQLEAAYPSDIVPMLLVDSGQGNFPGVSLVKASCATKPRSAFFARFRESPV